MELGHGTLSWHSYFFSMETFHVLFFYKTAEVIVPIISLLEHQPRNGGMSLMYSSGTLKFSFLPLWGEHPDHQGTDHM